MPPPNFSRIALAAALLEYDNDSEDPNVVKRSAQESAIFSHLRRSGPITKPQSVLEYDDLPEPRRSKDYLNIPLPSDDADLISPTSPQNANFGPPTRRSRDGRRSLDVLQSQGNQFFQQQEDGTEHESEADDVDLTSWGLDSLMPAASKPKDKSKPSRRPGPAKLRPASQHLDDLPNPHSPQDMDEEQPMQRRQTNARATSLFGDAGMKNLFLDPHDTENTPATFPLSGRRHTMAIPDEFGDMKSAPPLRPHSAAGIDPALVPFPSSRPGSALDQLENEDNAFAVPLPPPERMSKFDPKAARHSRTLSGGSWISTDELNEARKRTQSNVSMGSRGGALDVPSGGDERAPSVMTGGADAGNRFSQMPPPSLADQRRISRMELMRPKVLIMPSPLRDRANDPDPVQEELRRRNAGFLDSTGDRPLPANFRASSSMPVRPSLGGRPGSSGLNELLAPNPRSSLSTTQLMFRNNLMVGGERDVSYMDIEGNLQRANVDGEKIDSYAEDPDFIDAEYREMHRPTGKLMGSSLMDALEARKKEIKGKQRVFRGDDRPSMMTRSTSGLNRQTTLIDPATLNMPSVAVVDGEGRPIVRDEEGGLVRRGTKRASSAPLLDLGDGGLSPPGRPGMKTRGSVFGVDTVWEREVSKLEKLKQAELEEDAERQATMKKSSSKGKRKSSPLSNENTPPIGPSTSRESNAPVLPDISRVSTSGRPRAVPMPDSDDEELDGDAQASKRQRRRVSTATLGVTGWFAGGDSDEDDNGSRLTPGSRALTPNSTGAKGAISPNGAPRLAPVVDDDEDEDVPLVAKAHQLRQSVFGLGGPPRGPPLPDDSDEDVPLSNIKAKPRVASAGSPKLRSPTSPASKAANDADSDEDNVPLGLRASTLFPPSKSLNISQSRPAMGELGATDDEREGDEDEDEKPLGLRYSVAPNAAQQQQYNAMLQQQQQQQQQQMYMQHMAQSSMASFSAMNAFGGMPFAPQMTGGSMGVPMGMGMGMPGMPMVAPPMLPNPADSAKITRVDAWRKGVAEGA